MRPKSAFRIAPNWPWIEKMRLASQFANMRSSPIFFDVILFLFSNLVTGPSFMSISSLILELWEFTFIRDWREIWKSEIPPSEFCSISGDWKFGGYFPNEMLLNAAQARVAAFIVSELLRENQERWGRGGGGKIAPSPILGLKKWFLHRCFHVNFAKLLRIHFLQNMIWRLLLQFLVSQSLLPFSILYSFLLTSS